VHLNPDGERLLADIAPSLEALTRAMERASGDGELMRLRLAVLPLFASQRLMPHLGELRAAHPELHIDIDTGAHGLARLDEGLDAAITITTEVDPHLYSRRMDTNCVVAIGARQLAEGPEALTHPSHLSRATIFLHRDLPDTWDYWREAVGLPDLQPAAIDHFDSGQLILDAAAQGLGVALMLESHLKEAHDDRLVQLFGIKVESPYSYWFACRRSSLRRRPVKIFHDWLFDTLLAS
jgi:LysR family glycine cleavage system transcriptional activator